jgi:hypothetical protein
LYYHLLGSTEIDLLVHLDQEQERNVSAGSQKETKKNHLSTVWHALIIPKNRKLRELKKMFEDSRHLKSASKVKCLIQLH